MVEVRDNYIVPVWMIKKRNIITADMEDNRKCIL